MSDAAPAPAAPVAAAEKIAAALAFEARLIAEHGPLREGYRTLAAEKARPVAGQCTADSGAATDCQPICEQPVEVRQYHHVPCYGWFADDLCARHARSNRGRVWPDEVIEIRLPNYRGVRRGY